MCARFSWNGILGMEIKCADSVVESAQEFLNLKRSNFFVDLAEATGRRVDWGADDVAGNYELDSAVLLATG